MALDGDQDDGDLVLVLAAPIPPFWERGLLAPTVKFVVKRPVAYRHHDPSGGLLSDNLTDTCLTAILGVWAD